VIIRETNSNYGFNLPWWDRLLGTYRAQPTRGHEGMTIGIGWLRESKRLTLPWLLAMPFTGKSGIHFTKIGKSIKQRDV
jgi:sterol desaturase/sphingolipid hydroxylase (fatty acid hydroxylase superfamily)